MAISFKSKPKPVTVSDDSPVIETTPVVADSATQEESAAPEPTKAPSSAVEPPKKSGLLFLKRGKAAQDEALIEDKKAELRDAKKENPRFRVFKDKEAQITFLDGDLDKNGILDLWYFREHQVNMNGKWGNYFICTEDQEGSCPICEGGLHSSYVGVMSVIDHTGYTTKAGVVVKDMVSLFIAKRDTLKLLQKYATKRGGLRGCTFDVARLGDKTPSVGGSFDFVSKQSEQSLVNQWKDRSKPIDVEKYMGGAYVSVKELRKLGFGTSSSPIGSGDTHGGDGGVSYDV